VGALRIVSAALCLGLAAAATADAAPRRVARAEPAGGPVLAGNSVVYAGVNARHQVEVRRVAPNGRTTVLARMGTHRFEGDPPFVALTASAIHVAADRIVVPGTDVFRYTETALTGPLDGPLAALDFHCRPPQNQIPADDADQPFSIDGGRLAFVREACANGVRDRRVVIRDLATGVESAGIPTSGVGVALAGRYVAFLDPADDEAVQVYDLERGAAAYSAPNSSRVAFDLQSDGKLALADYGDSACDGNIAWYSVTDPRRHPVEPQCGALTPMAIEDDRILSSTGRRLRVTQIGGATRTVDLPVDSEGPDTLDFDGERLVFGEKGCSPDTGSVWLVSLADRDTQVPDRPRCRIAWGRGPLTVDRRGRVAPTLSCPNGCRGSARLVRGNRSYASADFELRAGQAQRLRMRVRAVRSLFGRKRSVSARLETTVFTAALDGVADHSQSVTLRR
jgi:hypothetical protein